MHPVRLTEIKYFDTLFKISSQDEDNNSQGYKIIVKEETFGDFFLMLLCTGVYDLKV